MPIVGSKITEGKKVLSDLVQVLSDKRYGRSVRPNKKTLIEVLSIPLWIGRCKEIIYSFSKGFITTPSTGRIK